MTEDIFAYFDRLVPEQEPDWFQSAVECANAMYHLNGHLFERTNHERILTAKQQKLYRKRHPDKVRIRRMKRDDRQRNLPNTFTAADWHKAVDYFNGRCAVCERQFDDLFNERTAAADHWIPIASPDCPGTIPTNIVPLCHGLDGCNSKKSGNPPMIFLEQYFGKSKAKKIMARVQAYFDSLV